MSNQRTRISYSRRPMTKTMSKPEPWKRRGFIGWPDTLAILWVCAAVTVTATISPVVPLGLATIGCAFAAAGGWLSRKEG